MDFPELESLDPETFAVDEIMTPDKKGRYFNRPNKHKVKILAALRRPFAQSPWCMLIRKGLIELVVWQPPGKELKLTSQGEKTYHSPNPYLKIRPQPFSDKQPAWAQRDDTARTHGGCQAYKRGVL